MKQPPTLDYCGLLIVLGKPSRHDIDNGRLFTGWAGDQFKAFLNPIMLEECWVVDSSEPAIMPANTKAVLFLGPESLRWGGWIIEELSLNDARGNLIVLNTEKKIYGIASYAPQDAYDRKNYDDDKNDDAGENENLKSHGTTKRKNWRWWLMNDVNKVKALINSYPDVSSDTPEKYGLKTILQPNSDNIIQALRQHRAVPGETLVLDIETDRHLNMTCFGFHSSLTPDKIFVVPVKSYDNTLFYPAHVLFEIIIALGLAMANSLVICHNSCFDLFVLCLRYKIPFPKRIFDTMLAWHRCNPEVEKSLGHLISFFLFKRFHKSDGIWEPRNFDQMYRLWSYNGEDIFTTLIIYTKLQKYIVEKHAVESVNFANRMIRPYLTMQFLGMKLDVEKFKEVFAYQSKKKYVYEQCLKIVTNIPTLNPRSYAQVGKYLYETLGLECPDETQPTNEKTLLRLLTSYKKKTGKATIPSVNIILAVREAGKVASSMKFKLWDRNYPGRENENVNNFNRLTTAYNLAGTDTFRLSSRALLKFKEGNKKGWGTNVQNWDKNQRKLVIADEGKILIQIDQAGAEALIVAYLCRPGKFRELFINNVKPHVFVALHLFANKWKAYFGGKLNEAIDHLLLLRPRDLKKHPNFEEVERVIKASDDWPDKERYYFIAKMVCHAANYGMKAPTFILNVLQKSKGAIVLTLQEGREFLEMYHALFPEITEWHYQIIMDAEHCRVMKNLFGEPRTFLDFKGDSLYKQMYAFVPQSTVGEITNRAIVEFQEELDKHYVPFLEGTDILQNNHDSALIQCINSPDIIDYNAQLLHSFMTPKLVYKGTEFSMKAEIQIGYNWGPAKEGNLGGLVGYKLKY